MTSAPILVATDMSNRSDRAMARAFRIARDLGAPVVVMTVLDDAMPADLMPDLHDRSRERLERYCATLSGGTVPFTVEIQTGDPTEDILAAVEARQPRLLVLGSHRPRAFMDMVRETTLQRIVRHTSAPVLLAMDRDDHDYRSVLVPTDFSPASASAARIALEIAPQAQLSALHALQVPYSGMLATAPAARDELEKPFRNDAKRSDALWRQELDLASMPPTEIVLGAPQRLMRDRVRQGQADLIAVGAHGRVGAGRAILGSVSTDLMRDPPCDLLIARP